MILASNSTYVNSTDSMIPGGSDPAGCGCWSCFQIHFPEQLVTRESPSNHVGAETEVITHNEFRTDQMNIKGWVGCRLVYMQHYEVLIVFCGDKFPTKYVLSFTLCLTLDTHTGHFWSFKQHHTNSQEDIFLEHFSTCCICRTVHIWANTVLNVANLLLSSWHSTVWEGKVKIYKSVPSLGCIRWVRACIPAGKVWTWTGANRQLGAEALDHICKCITCSINFHHYHQTEVQPAGRSTWTHLHHLLHCHLNLFALWFRRSPAN